MEGILVALSNRQWVGLSCILMASTIAIREYIVTNPSEDSLLANHTQEQVNADSPNADHIIAISAQGNTEATSVQIIEPVELTETVRIGKGDTLMSILTSKGINRESAHGAVLEFAKVFNPKALKIGQEIQIKFKRGGETSELLSLDFKAPTGNEFTLTYEDGNFKAKKFEIQLTKTQRSVRGQISSSFYSAALKKGVPADIVKEAISALSYDINWQHDPQSGDEFEILFDVYEDPQGNIIKKGNLRYASFAPNGQVRKIYYYENTKGTSGYFTAKGESIVKTLLQTPLDPTKMRVTSRFGVRHHPVLGYSKLHKGVDFGAPVGTPVMSAGDGVVVKACWYGAYGNYVLIRHNSDYSTAYAHLSSIAVKPGQRIKQRQVIGKVGATGRATGPHLHHEVIYRGNQVNPQSIKQLPATKLDAKEMAIFQNVRAQMDKDVSSGAVTELAAHSIPITAG